MNGKILSQQLTLGQDGSLFAYIVNNNEYLNYRYNYSNISGQKLRIEVCHQSTVQKPVLSLYGTFSWDSKYAGSQFSSSITGSKIIFLFYVIFFPLPILSFMCLGIYLLVCISQILVVTSTFVNETKVRINFSL